MLRIATDGLCEPNPGGTGTWAFVAYLDNEPVREERGSLGCSPNMTNNVAEYLAVGKALAWCQIHGHRNPAICSDSQVVVQQINGKYACRTPRLIPLRDRAQELVAQTEAIVVWVPRESVQEADKLTRLAYQEATGQWPPERGHK